MLINGDCLEEMPKLANDGVKVDLVLTDPPYAVTLCEWDTIIPIEPMWDCLNEITNPTTPICLFGVEPFSSYLRLSNEKNYKYDWIWEKHKATNFIQCNKRPLKYHELISVFYEKQCKYNKQMIPRESERVAQAKRTGWVKKDISTTDVCLKGGLSNVNEYMQKWDANLKNPSQILRLPGLVNNSKEYCNHPSQKPIKTLEYLIKTYTDEGDTVLDFTMGSGSTGVACANLNREFIGIELDKEYYNIAVNRIKEAKAQQKLI